MSPHTSTRTTLKLSRSLLETEIRSPSPCEGAKIWRGKFFSRVTVFCSFYQRLKGKQGRFRGNLSGHKTPNYLFYCRFSHSFSQASALTTVAAQSFPPTPIFASTRSPSPCSSPWISRIPSESLHITCRDSRAWWPMVQLSGPELTTAL